MKNYNQLKRNSTLYEGCRNRLLIVELDKFYKKDNLLRKSLSKIGIETNADSVMVITGNPKEALTQGFHVTMDVFEPRGHDPDNPELEGSWSTMCGNGIRAVVRYLLDNKKISKKTIQCFVKTGSGILPVTILSKNNFKVSMGKFTSSADDLSEYVSNFNLNKLSLNGIKPKDIFVGLNGMTNGKGTLDGEPHLVLVLPETGVRVKKLKRIISEIGDGITPNRDFFPREINTNIVSLTKQKNSTLSLNACTFERGVNYVTQACGTGATVIGAWFLTNNRKLKKVVVNMPGGRLQVTRNNKDFFLTGPANQVK